MRLTQKHDIMNEFKHMPGYWFVNNERGTLVTANNGEKHGWQMSNVCQPYGFTDEQRIATAKLIAAAPELLDAAQYAIECLERLDTELGQIGDNGDQAYNALKQAIEKATK